MLIFLLKKKKQIKPPVVLFFCWKIKWGVFLYWYVDEVTLGIIYTGVLEKKNNFKYKYWNYTFN